MVWLSACVIYLAWKPLKQEVIGLPEGWPRGKGLEVPNGEEGASGSRGLVREGALGSVFLCPSDQRLLPSPLSCSRAQG